ncbi:GDP-mannose 4,6-dehydratase [Catellatospora chokoriensis]|uniref:Epimerase n=1 Tax=Catellatospora chokoriensis TaxID=310353 RepID=A0A8J3JSJ9_9ACTN|nr:epimerase [Catellatospora chokoriensis]
MLLSGGAGFVPSHLADRLIDGGCRVVALDNFVTGSPENVRHLSDDPRFELIEADVCDGLPDHPSMSAPFDAVLHFASPASPVDFERIPVEIMKVGSLGTMHLLERARTDGARFILASTSEAYGDPLVHPQPESYWGNVNPVGPRSVYDEAKRFAEALTMAYHRKHGVSVGIVRIFNTYGPRMRPDDGRAVPAFISQALQGRPLTVHGTGEQTRSICYVDDLVSGIVALLESGQTGPVNCGTDHEMTMLDLATAIIRLTGSASEVTFVERTADDPERRRPDLALSRELLGYQPQVAPEQGLLLTIEDFRRRLQHC